MSSEFPFLHYILFLRVFFNTFEMPSNTIEFFKTLFLRAKMKFLFFCKLSFDKEKREQKKKPLDKFWKCSTCFLLYQHNPLTFQPPYPTLKWKLYVFLFFSISTRIGKFSALAKKGKLFPSTHFTKFTL